MRPKFLRAGRLAGLDWEQLALLVWTVVLLVVCVRTAIQPRTRSLFYTWASAGADWKEGKNLYFHDLWPCDETGRCYLDQFRYSPAIAVSFVPLALIDERAGNVLWRLFNAGVLAGGLWWWLGTVLLGPQTRSLKGLVLLFVVPLALASLNNGQTNPLVIGFLLAATAALHEERWSLAALFITLACALKLYPIAVGLLLVVIYPRQLSWRLALMLMGAGLLPFCCQRPGYVLAQYEQWYQLLGSDHARKNFPLEIAYRDLWLLFRVWNEHMTPALQIPITSGMYFAIQLATAALCAVMCLAARRVGVSKTGQRTAALMLGSCWMTVCGPATESASFVQIAPALAWALLAAHRERWPVTIRWLPVASTVLFVISVLAGVTPRTKEIHALGLQPLATLLLFIAYLAIAVRRPLLAYNAADDEPSLAARAA